MCVNVPNVRYLRIELTQDLSWSLHYYITCVLKRGSLLDCSTVAFTNMLTQPLFSNCISHLSDHTWSIVQLCGMHTSPGHRGLGESSVICSSYVLKELVSRSQPVVLTVADISPYPQMIKCHGQTGTSVQNCQQLV